MDFIQDMIYAYILDFKQIFKQFLSKKCYSLTGSCLSRIPYSEIKKEIDEQEYRRHCIVPALCKALSLHLDIFNSMHEKQGGGKVKK